MKTIACSIILLFLVCISGEAMEVFFSAQNAKSGRTVTLDSVRVINSFRKIDTVVKTNSVVLPDYSRVDDINAGVDFVTVLENSPGKDIIFNVKMESSSSITINVVNILGQSFNNYRNILDIGSYRFSYGTSGLPPGLYLLLISDGRHSVTIKTMVTVSSPSTGDNLKLIEECTRNTGKINRIETNDDYKFIGYLNGFYNDTLSNIIPKNNDSLNFKINSFAIWDFVKGSFKIENINILLQHKQRYIAGRTDNNSCDTSKESLKLSYSIANIKLDSSYEYYLNFDGLFIKCKDVYSINDTIKFCSETFSLQQKQSNSLSATIVIDSTKRLITDLTISIYKHIEIRTGFPEPGKLSYYLEDDRKSFRIKDIPYNIDKNGKLISTINGSIIKDKIYFLYYSISTQAVEMSHYTFNNMDAISIDSIGDDAYITLELEP